MQKKMYLCQRFVHTDKSNTMSKIIRIEEMVYSRLPHVSKADWIDMLINNGVNADYTTILNDYLLLEYADYRFKGDKMLSSERRVYNIDYCTYDLEENADADDDTLEITYVHYNRSIDHYIVRYAHYPASEKYTSPELPYVFSETDAPEDVFVEPKMILPQPAESSKVEIQKSSISPGILDNPKLKKYQNYFASLKRSNRNGELAPHKLILMLAIMKLYESPKQYKTVLVKLTPELIELFNHYWREYVNSPIWIMDINMPWTHMKSEPFWHECYNTAKGCWIDEELKTLFRNVYYREALRKVLLEQLNLSSTITNTTEAPSRSQAQNHDVHRSNKRWNKGELRKLINAFRLNKSFTEIACQLHRTETAIASKLQELGYIYWDKTKEMYIKI